MDNNRKIRWGSHLLGRIVLIVHLKDREHAENAMVLTELDLRIVRYSLCKSRAIDGAENRHHDVGGGRSGEPAGSPSGTRANRRARHKGGKRERSLKQG